MHYVCFAILLFGERIHVVKRLDLNGVLQIR